MPRKEQRSSKPEGTRSDKDSGLYLLLLELTVPGRIRIGSIGRIEFKRGFYAYCGSARRNLSARLSRHVRKQKRRHWHIDYLTSRRDVRIDSARTVPVDGLSECALNSRIQELPRAEPVRRFGCSDCNCSSHLTFLGPEAPGLRVGVEVLNDRF